MFFVCELGLVVCFFFFSSRRRHTRFDCDWSSDVCSSDLLTLGENVEFYAGLYGLAGAELARRWGALRARFALIEAEGERPEDLPAGIRQRAGLAVSIMHRPRLLFLDEPTAGVDVRSRALFWELIQEEGEAGATIFVTTHFLEEADYCERVCFIDAGRLIADAPPE